MKILETERTILREITTDDAKFILKLLNEPSFIKYIGDRNVRSVEQAREYIESRFLVSYKDHGFGLYKVELKTDGTPIGICGFVKRESLPDADIGFAFLAQFEKQGYGFETADAIMKYGKDVLNFGRVLAIASLANESSHRLLEKLGLNFERLIKVSDDEELKLFAWES